MERIYQVTDPQGNKWFTVLDHYGDGKEMVSDVLIVVAAVCAIATAMLWVMT